MLQHNHACFWECSLKNIVGWLRKTSQSAKLHRNPDERSKRVERVQRSSEKEEEEERKKTENVKGSRRASLLVKINEKGNIT